MNDSGLQITDEIAENVGTYISSGIGDFWAIEREHEKLLKGGPSRVSPFFIPSAIVNLASGQVSIRHNAKGPNSATRRRVRRARTRSATALRSFNAACRCDDLRRLNRDHADERRWVAALRALSTRNDDPTHLHGPLIWSATDS